MLKTVMLGVVLFAGCAADPSSPSSDDPAVAEPSGEIDPAVARFEIKQFPNLDIVGYDRAGRKVGELTAKFGSYYDDEWGKVVDGTMIDVEAHGLRMSHRSAGRVALTLPMPTGMSEIEPFVLDSRLTAVLGRWDIAMTPIHFGDTPDDHEKTYSGCTYSVPCGPYECDEEPNGSGGYMQYICCPSGPTAVNRLCTTPNDYNGCGQAGPNGCSVCWSGQQNGCSTNPGAGGINTCSRYGEPCGGYGEPGSAGGCCESENMCYGTCN